MDPTIFYSWQSDRIEKTHRYLIRDAIEQALKRIGRNVNVEDSPRLDHDTKGVPGTPEIAGTIFRKIQESGVFIADLTFIGATDTHDGDRKLVPNPNVLLELGYAARSIGWDRIICVMNTAWGPAEKQIFDIKQRRWPICYMLEGVSPEGIRSTRAYLSGQLQNAILMVMNNAHEAVEEAISRLTPLALQLIEKQNHDYFWIEPKIGGVFHSSWMTDATACLLELKLIRAYFEPDPEVNRYVYTWTYTGRLLRNRMRPNFHPIPPGDANENVEVDPVVPESQRTLPADSPPNSLTLLTSDTLPTSETLPTSDGVRSSRGSLLTWLHRIWARRT